MKTKKEIKRAVKEAEQQIKRFRRGLEYVGVVDNICFIYKEIKNPVAGNVVYVLNGATRFIEKEDGNYIRVGRKYVDICEYKGDITCDTPRYIRQKDHNVFYLYTGKSWVKC